MNSLIAQRVAELFVSGRYNCAMTSLAVLGEVFDIPLEPQTLAAARCLPAVGDTGGLCGLVSGALMFIGVWSAAHGFHRSDLGVATAAFVAGVYQVFGSAQCCDLRSEETGCGPLAVRVIGFAATVLEEEFAKLLRGGF
ncbi:MAG: C-GCAxxG-C-C family protein [Anaerolineae bacterium]|nr:C-GCAxxG-C-C family protein [Anaerolineae bacterium]